MPILVLVIILEHAVSQLLRYLKTSLFLAPKFYILRYLNNYETARSNIRTDTRMDI